MKGKGNGIEYVLVEDFYIPDLKLLEEERSIGKYGRIHREYLKECYPARFNDLVLSCQLWTYLADINEQAQNRLEVIIAQMKKAESVTEKMKEDNQWACTARNSGSLYSFLEKGILTAAIKVV